MGIAIFIGVIALFVVVLTVYGNWLEKGFRPRSVDTALPPTHVRAIFADKVARLGWKIVDDDNPMVAQSGLLGGRRQQISLQLTHGSDGRVQARIAVPRFWRKAGMPYKAHTLRIRMNGFLSAVQANDPTSRIAG